MNGNDKKHTIDRGRDAKILELWQGGASLRTIAEAIGVTAGRIRQIMRRMRLEGTEFSRAILRTRQLMGELGVSAFVLYKLLKATGLAQTAGKQIGVLLKDLPRLCTALKELCSCKLCGKRIGFGKVCKGCRPEWKIQSRARRFKESPDERNSYGTPRKILLACRNLPGSGETVCWSKALALSGLTPMQLNYAAHRHLIDSTQTGTKSNCRGKPARCYYVNQLLAIKKALKEGGA